MVGSSLAAKEHAPKADARGLERQIDELAYELSLTLVLRDTGSRMKRLLLWKVRGKAWAGTRRPASASLASRPCLPSTGRKFMS